MKTQTNSTVRCASGASVPLAMPARSQPRPARRGNFWPGESFGNCTHQWDLVGALKDRALMLPAIQTGNHTPKI